MVRGGGAGVAEHPCGGARESGRIPPGQANPFYIGNEICAAKDDMRSTGELANAFSATTDTRELVRRRVPSADGGVFAPPGSKRAHREGGEARDGRAKKTSDRRRMPQEGGLRIFECAGNVVCNAEMYNGVGGVEGIVGCLDFKLRVGREVWQAPDMFTRTGGWTTSNAPGGAGRAEPHAKHDAAAKPP